MVIRKEFCQTWERSLRSHTGTYLYRFHLLDIFVAFEAEIGIGDVTFTIIVLREATVTWDRDIEYYYTYGHE
jgi:hypothetical protein